MSFRQYKYKSEGEKTKKEHNSQITKEFRT